MIRAASHDRLAHMADDVRQLTEPIHVAIPCHLRDHRDRGRTCPGHIRTDPPLLDQLREAADRRGSQGKGPERRPVPSSRPPGPLDPVDALSGLYVDLAGWHRKLDLPSPPAFAHGCHHGSCQLLMLGRDPNRNGPTCSRASLERLDWHKTVLRALVGAAPTLAPSIADWLAADVESWWHDAAVGSGWRPDDLRRLR